MPKMPSGLDRVRPGKSGVTGQKSAAVGVRSNPASRKAPWTLAPTEIRLFERRFRPTPAAADLADLHRRI